MRKILLIAVLIAGCGPAPEPDPVCDYCHKSRPGTMVYPCRKCGKTHRSCDREAPLHALEYSKASKTGEAGGAVGRAIKNCPE